jgi:16S rRNA (adenine1518-N6/adenine1519-N6)-dimethyltransferase
VVFSNAPYQISNPLILYLVKNRAYIKKAYLTFQKEFVNKLIAGPSNSAYGFLSCYLQYYAKVNKIFDIPAKAFSPVPKVDSSFISIDFYKELPQTAKDEDFLFKLIRKAFSQRRKKISNSLSQFTSSQHFFSSLKISPDVRAENISLKQYVAIANRIYCEKFDQ